MSAQSGITILSGKKCLDLWGQIQDVTCQVHVRTIALALGVSRDTVRDALRRLVDNGVITIEYRAGIVGPRTDPMQSASIYHMGPALAAALSKQLDHLQSLRVAREE
ncbi:GntR family transcriptional regulator [Aeromonas veronii]|uniref:GntR family transcriptional regulator n=1 Tax=Aeromonas veronii TaxID=654 RepID=UPI00389996D0